MFLRFLIVNVIEEISIYFYIFIFILTKKVDISLQVLNVEKGSPFVIVEQSAVLKERKTIREREINGSFLATAD